MHILIFFLISAAFLGGYYHMTETPKGEMEVIPVPGQSLRLYPSVVPAAEIQQDRLVRQTFDYSCGSAALATLLNYYIGEEFTEKQVISGLLRYGDKEAITSRRAFSLLDMKRFVNVLGYEGAGYTATLEDLKTLDRPCIIPVTVFDYRHFVVFKGITQGHVIVSDPWWGNTSYPLAEFEAHWYRNAIFLVSPKKGGRALNALRLKEEDLRFIDEDTARNILFPHEPPWPNEREWELEKSFPIDSAVQSKHLDSIRVIQAPEPTPDTP